MRNGGLYLIYAVAPGFSPVISVAPGTAPRVQNGTMVKQSYYDAGGHMIIEAVAQSFPSADGSVARPAH